MGNDHPQYLGKTDARGKWTGKVECCDWLLDKPLHWRKPRRVFVCSMSDLFHEKVPFEFVDKVFDTIWKTNHTYLILTKRPARIGEYLEHCRDQRVARTPNKNGCARPTILTGVSVCVPEEKPKIDTLRTIPAAVKFVSFEPLLRDMGELDLTGIDWVIVGGESGPGARPMHPDWARSIRDQCAAARVAFFMKQMGGHPKKRAKLEEIPEDLRIRDYPVREIVL
jgi:protein gp37